MTKFIITGGLGFIGQRLIKNISNLEIEKSIIVVDSIESKVHPKLPRSDVDFKLVVGDVAERKTWNDLNTLLDDEKENDPIFVYHLASDTSTALSASHPGKTVRSNSLGTANLLEWSYSRISDIEKIVLTSSRAVYGEGLWLSGNGQIVQPSSRKYSDLRIGEWRPIVDTFPCVEPLGVNARECVPTPSNIYGLTKLHQEHLLELWSSTYGIPLSIFRLQNIYGPGQSLTNPYSGIIANFIRCALDDREINVFEDGGIIRDFVHVEDVVKALTKSIRDSQQKNILDVGSGRPMTLLKAAEIIIELSGSNSKLYTSKDFRVGDVRSIFYKNTETSQTDTVTFEKGLSETIEWARTVHHRSH